ncbi:hypothetical protein FB451DRAFT_673390 [Mycena latifolia]|nr:hypothetical protein FB451DRAFT_673390 [Mycena latifolia]
MVPCGQRISCWRAFHKHQIKHCATRKKNHNGVAHYICRLNKCSAKLHTSGVSLKTHIELSHLKHLPLPCPFTNSKPSASALGGTARLNTFSRSRDLVLHLQEQHANLMGRELDMGSKLLLPRWEPHRPVPLPVPPALPHHISSGSLFIGDPITVYPTPHLTRIMSDSGTSLPASHIPKAPQRRKMLQATTFRDESPPKHHHRKDVEYEFADLPDVEYHQPACILTPAGIMDAPHFVVKRVGALRKDLVRPPPMPEAPMKEEPPPPTSIFYDTLRKQVMEQYALGEGAATDF